MESRANTPDPSQLRLIADAGLELIPLHGWNAVSQGNKAMGKAPVGRDWRNRPSMTAEEAAAHMREGGNRPLGRLAERYALPLTDTAQTVTGSGGYHIFLRLPDDVADRIASGGARVVNRLDGFKGIEFKGLGRQVVAPGSLHPETGEHYALDDDTARLDLMHVAEAPAALVDAIVRDVGPKSATGYPDISPEQLAGALDQLDPTDFRDHDRWLELMVSAPAATGGSGLDEFVAWSTSDPVLTGDMVYSSNRNPGYAKALDILPQS